MEIRLLIENIYPMEDKSINAAAFHLKVSITSTGEATILRVDDNMTVGEVIKMVEEKKNQQYKEETHCIKFLFMDGTKQNALYEHMTLKNFHQIDKLLIESIHLPSEETSDCSSSKVIQLPSKLLPSISGTLLRSGSNNSLSFDTMSITSKNTPKAFLKGVFGSFSKRGSERSSIAEQAVKESSRSNTVSELKTKNAANLVNSPTTTGSLNNMTSEHFSPTKYSSQMGTLEKAQELNRKRKNGSDRNSILSLLSTKLSDDEDLKSHNHKSPASAPLNPLRQEIINHGDSIDTSESRISVRSHPDSSTPGFPTLKAKNTWYPGNHSYTQSLVSIRTFGTDRSTIDSVIDVEGHLEKELYDAASEAVTHLLVKIDMPSVLLDRVPGEPSPISGVDFSNFLQPDEQISEEAFQARFNSRNGNVWTTPISDFASDKMQSLSTVVAGETTDRPFKEILADPTPIFFKFHFFTENAVIMKINGDVKLETFLKRVCQRRSLDYALHSLEYEEDRVQKPAELDHAFVTFSNPQGIPFQIYLVKKSKVYSSISKKENQEETIVSNVIEGKPVITACKGDKIFNLLTNPYMEDEEFANMILLTYRNFATPEEFLTYLIRDFYVRLSYDPTDDEYDSYDRLHHLHSLKILKVLHTWIEHHWHDFGLNSEMRALLNTFLAVICNTKQEYAEVARGILFVAEIQYRWFSDLLESYSKVTRKGKKIESILADVEADAIAEQLCISNNEMFKNIHPIEFLNEIWKKTDTASSPSFQFFVERFDKESYWVATEICTLPDPKQRVGAMKKFISIIKHCLDLNNFFSVFALISGLNLIPVQRLKKTWEALPEKSKLLWAEVEKVADPSKNMKIYRDRLALARPPMVPFLPIYLKDLTFMNDGNPSKVKGLINIDKLRRMANSVQEIASLGSASYTHERIAPLINWLQNFSVNMDINELKKLATEYESLA